MQNQYAELYSSDSWTDVREPYINHLNGTSQASLGMPWGKIRLKQDYDCNMLLILQYKQKIATPLISKIALYIYFTMPISSVWVKGR